MQDLNTEKTMSILADKTDASNLIFILLVVLTLYILYQVVMLIFQSSKLRKLNKLRKLSVVNDNRSKGIEQSTVVTPKVADEERQDDIRTLLRGKR